MMLWAWAKAINDAVCLICKCSSLNYHSHSVYLYAALDLCDKACQMPAHSHKPCTCFVSKSKATNIAQGLCSGRRHQVPKLPTSGNRSCAVLLCRAGSVRQSCQRTVAHPAQAAGVPPLSTWLPCAAHADHAVLDQPGDVGCLPGECVLKCGCIVIQEFMGKRCVCVFECRHLLIQECMRKLCAGSGNYSLHRETTLVHSILYLDHREMRGD